LCDEQEYMHDLALQRHRDSANQNLDPSPYPIKPLQRR
jgi:hypothetical protein